MIDVQPATRREKRLLKEDSESEKEAVVVLDSEAVSESEKQMNSVPVTTGGLPQLTAKSPATTRGIPAPTPEHTQKSKTELLKQIQEEEEKLDHAAEAFVRQFQQKAIEQETKEREYQAAVDAWEKRNARIRGFRRLSLRVTVLSWTATAIAFITMRVMGL